jgi:AmmeMemoRadiSam system protein A
MACPQPDDLQRTRLLRHCARLVGEAVRRESLVEPDLGDMASWLVDGCFVSLHRGEELRSCCGLIGGPHALPGCLQRAAWRAACDDPRFPSITEEELPRLELEIHLLHSWQRCEATPVERPAQIVIGRHGLVIHRQHQSGLLLPVVASDRGWDAVTFLDQCCRKAGLPTNAWHDPGTELELFQAHYLAAPLNSLGD